MENFRDCFSDAPDPRAANSLHDLVEILFIGLSAVLCGAEGCTDMADFGRAKEGFLRTIPRLEHSIPSHDTFSRVFGMLDPTAFEAAFRQFMAAFGQAVAITGVVAIDGKAVRGAFERGRKTTPLHLVNVWAVDARLALAQRTAPNRNEVAGAQEVLALLSLGGCIVTADALYCHAGMARTFLARDADYVLALKEIQPALRAAAQQRIESATCRDQAMLEQPVSHGRYERRQAGRVRRHACRRARLPRHPGRCAPHFPLPCRGQGYRGRGPLFPAIPIL